jgi:hypothetical protein
MCEGSFKNPARADKQQVADRRTDSVPRQRVRRAQFLRGGATIHTLVLTPALTRAAENTRADPTEIGTDADREQQL